jgi:hypothetical protein
VGSSLPIDLIETYSDKGTASSKMQQLPDLPPPVSDDEAESTDESSWTSRTAGVHWEPPDLPEVDDR